MTELPFVLTDIPGPCSKREYAAVMKHESNARTYSRAFPVLFSHGRGSMIWDVDGNCFLDMLMGAGALALGHANPDIAQAISEQAAKLTSGLDLFTSARAQFFEILRSRLPEPFNNYIFHLCGPTGSDSVEAALKLAYSQTGRDEIIVFERAYHGTSIGAQFSSDIEMRPPFCRDGVDNIHRLPFPSSDSTSGNHVLKQAEKILHSRRIAAVLFEPIQGEGGVVVLPAEFFSSLHQLAKESDTLLIADEVQTGIGRTYRSLAGQPIL